MDSAAPRGSPGFNREDGVCGPILTSVEGETTLDCWTSSNELSEVQKDASSASRLLFLTVEYVEESEADYSRSTFAAFESGTPFTPSQPSSLPDFEHRVSLLDPNMVSTSHYSPVYTMSGNSNSLNMIREMSSDNTTNPNSIFRSQIVVLTNPSSPIINSTHSALSSPQFTDTSNDHSSSTSAVTNIEITQSFVNHVLSNSVASPISLPRESGDNLLERGVNENYFSSTNSLLTNDLGGSSINPNSPRSPIQPPLTPTDNYVVSSSTETSDGLESRSSDFHSSGNVIATVSPSAVDSTSDVLIHSTMQSSNEIADGAEASFHDLIPAEVVTLPSNVPLKSDASDRVQLLISSSSESVTYSLDGHASFLQTRVIDVGSELLEHSGSDEHHLNSVVHSYKLQGLELGHGENGDLQLRHLQTDINSDEKLGDTDSLSLREMTFAMRAQQNDLLDQTLLSTPLNNDLSESVAGLSESLLDDGKISNFHQSLQAVGAYSDILREAGCVDDVIPNDISNDMLSQESPEFCCELDSTNFAKVKGKPDGGASNAMKSQLQDYLPNETLYDADIISSLNDVCSTPYFQSNDTLLHFATASLPIEYLSLGKLAIKKPEELGYGVFAHKIIPKGTLFGPILGTVDSSVHFATNEEENKQLMFLIETDCGKIKKLCISGEKSSCWIRFVRIALSFKQQNIILCEQEKSLFFVTTRTILPRQELRVWYSLSYAKKHSLPVLQEVKFEVGDGCPSSNWLCFKCNRNFNNSVELQWHLNTHEFDSIKKEHLYNINHVANIRERRSYSKISKNNRSRSRRCYSRTCLYRCHYCNHSFKHIYNIRKVQDFNSNHRIYLCEVCGHQFFHTHSSDCHVRGALKKIKVESSKRLLVLGKRRKLNVDGGIRKNIYKTEWFCNHCNLSINNPSICNLHTLAHAAENVKETEGHHFPERKQSVNDERCPKCTKKIENSDFMANENGVVKQILPTCHLNVHRNSLENKSVFLKSNDRAVVYEDDEKCNFIGNRVMDLVTSELLTNCSTEDHQFGSVLNPFKIEDDKLSSDFDLQDLTLSIHLPHDELEEKIMGYPLNGDFPQNVNFNNYGDVKVPIDKRSEAVGTFSNILTQSSGVENLTDNESTSNNVSCEPTLIFSMLSPANSKETKPTHNTETITETRIFASGKSTLKKCGTKGIFPVGRELSQIKSYLCIKRISKKKQSNYGVFACKTIPCGTRIGPLKGALSDWENFSEDSDDLKKNLIFLIETEIGKVMKLDITNKSFKWLQFVRIAPSVNEQNVILSQQGRSLFLTTSKVIHRKQELRVWYNMHYVKQHKLPLPNPIKTNVTAPHLVSCTWQCFECKEYFESCGALQYHLNIHGLNQSHKNFKYFHHRYFTIHHYNHFKPPYRSLRNRRYSCEICGCLFSSSYSKYRHIQKNHTIEAKRKQEALLPLQVDFLQSNEECKKNKYKTEWFCTHCNLTFDNPSVCNLHTLAHAAENLQETEVVDAPHHFESGFKGKGIKNTDFRCPNCTKKVESYDCRSIEEHGISESMPESIKMDVQSFSLPNTTASNNSMVAYNLNGQANFVENRDVDTEELSAQDIPENHQIDSEYNSFKMQEFVIGESECTEIQMSNSSHSKTQSDDKISCTLGLRDMALTIQQQNELLSQTLLSTSLNADLTETVNRLNKSIINDVKISIADPSVESVTEYSDIVMDTTSAGNVVQTCSSESNLIDSCVSCADLDPLSNERWKKNAKNKDSLTNIEVDNNGSKAMGNVENSDSFDSGCYSSHVQSIEDKSSLSFALSSLPASYLVISKIRNHKNEEPLYGVFARKVISEKTRFGPLEGVLVDDIEYVPNGAMQGQYNFKTLVLLLESEDGTFKKFDVTQGKSSSWMQYVRIASSFKEQNLILSQQGQSLFFIATKIILPKQELKVWYSLQYAKKRNLPLLQHEVLFKKYLEGVDKIWPCFECSEKFSCSEGLQIHLNIHNFERGDTDFHDNHRMKKVNRSFRRKLPHHFPRKYKSTSDEHCENHPYQCTICNRAFPRNYNLKRHQLLHAKDKNFVCEIGGYQFSHLYNRERHIHKRHKDLNGNGNSRSLSTFLKNNIGLKTNSLGGCGSIEWFCTHCDLTFDNLSVLNLHTVSHGGKFMPESENLQCPQCLHEFHCKKELIDHVANHGKLLSQRRLRGSLNPDKPWKCELCYKSFATEDRLQRHMLVHGAEESKPLQCDVCYKRFLNNSALACHIKIHTERKMFECPICKVVFDQVLSLKEHVYSHSVDGLYTCPQCNKVFDGYSLIRKHIRAFHSDRKHTCNYCGKLFPKLDKLRMHMLRHSDHREFLCANCGKQFKRKDKLKEHMKRMHSAERELRLAMKPHRPPAAKKFMPKVQVSPTDYHRFIYKCHTCLLGFKRRGMLVNHLAKRHPDISPESVPELNLPILKTTRDYYCQYCEKVYKSSSKRKAHILKIHPGAELPMSNRRKGGVPEIPGQPNPTFSQTVGSITTHPHSCPWCHKQYASKAKLLQHQRKKHYDLLPQSQQVPRLVRNTSSPSQREDKTISSPQLTSANDQEPCHASSESLLILPSQSISHQNECPLNQLEAIENVINIIPGDYINSADDLRDFQESGIIIDATGIERPVKVFPDVVSADLLCQAMSDLTNEFRVTVANSPNDHYLRIVQTSPGHITVTQTPTSAENHEKESLTSATVNAFVGDTSSMSPASSPAAIQPSSHLHQLLSESFSLTSSSSPSSSPHSWSDAHVSYTPFTAR